MKVVAPCKILLQLQNKLDLTDSFNRHWLHHHLSVHPVGPHTVVLYHGSSIEYGQVQQSEAQVLSHSFDIFLK